VTNERAALLGRRFEATKLHSLLGEQFARPVGDRWGDQDAPDLRIVVQVAFERAHVAVDLADGVRADPALFQFDDDGPAVRVPP